MKEVTLYKIEKEQICVQDGRDILEIHSIEHSIPIRNSGEFVAPFCEKIGVPIERVYGDSKNELYVAYDESFHELVALYQSDDKNAVEKILERSRRKTKQYIHWNMKWQLEVKDHKVTQNSLDSYREMHHSFWKRFKFLFRNKIGE